jgi:hypothetical protein
MSFQKYFLAFSVAAICLVLSLLLSLLPSAALAQKILTGQETMFVNLQNAKINFIPSASKELKWRILEGTSDSVQVSIKDTAIIVSDRYFSKPVSLEFEIPSLTLEVHLKEGSINVKNWKHPILIEATKAKVNLKALKSTAKVILLNGELVADENVGSIEADSFAAMVKITKQTGELIVSNFVGDTSIEKSQGSMQVSTTKGKSNIKDSSGTLKFDVKKGILSTNSFKGRMEGQILDGSVSLNPSEEADINVRSQKGRLTVVLPKDSSAYLSLSTEDGELYLPGNLKAYRDGSNKVYKGHARGGGVKGQVVARSSEGTIVVK